MQQIVQTWCTEQAQRHTKDTEYTLGERIEAAQLTQAVIDEVTQWLHKPGSLKLYTGLCEFTGSNDEKLLVCVWFGEVSHAWKLERRT